MKRIPTERSMVASTVRGNLDLRGSGDHATGVFSSAARSGIPAARPGLPRPGNGCRQRAQHARSGFTLLEISLVLALLVIVSALAVPNFQGTLAAQRLRKAAESIASNWTQTRALAMELGETQVWACELGAGQYAASASGAAVASGDQSVPVFDPASVDSLELTEALPDGFIISDAMTSESNSMSSMALASTNSQSGRVTLFFYPDGTCSHARLTVSHEDRPEDTYSVMVNGLAGTVRVLRGTSQ